MTQTSTHPVNQRHYGTLALLAIIIIALFAGSFYAYSFYENEKAKLQGQIGALAMQNEVLKGLLQNQSQVVFNVSLAQLYEEKRGSVVVIEGFVTSGGLFSQTTTGVQGSGFVCNYTGQMVIVTNNHVVDGVSDISVTFMNGTAYAANVLGRDAYSDLAVLEVVNAPSNIFKPLPLGFSSTLKVGDTVIALGNPYKLAGSMTTGIVSQLGRTITENTTGNYAIPNIIQFSAPINPGSSGGPLLNNEGQVIGITTAIVENSQGLGFAIPSDTIIREISYLMNGSYQLHPYIGVQGTDMDYYIANAMRINITYGFLITALRSGGPAEAAGLRAGTQTVQVEGRQIPIGGDIIIALNGTRIINYDALSSYFEENTMPGNTVDVTIKRDGISTPFNVSITLQPRPVQ